MIVVILFVLIIAVVLYSVSLGFQEKALIEIHRFEVIPAEFKTSEIGELHFKVENLIENDFTTMTVYLETHSNVKIYLGNNLLTIEGGNYTYTDSFSPKETREIVFRLKATVDIGDSRREYHVKAYIYVNGSFVITKIAPFSVRNS